MSLISGLLNQTIDTVYSITLDGYGDSTRTIVYRDVPCRWIETIKVIADKEARLRQARVEVWILPDYDIKSTYEIVKDSETYKIVGIEKRYTLSGVHDHTKLYLV